MTTINISQQKLITAASHALIDAKAEYEKASKAYNDTKGKRSFSSLSVVMAALDAVDLWSKRVTRLETLISAANVCDGLVCMSMEDVALVREYL